MRRSVLASLAFLVSLSMVALLAADPAHPGTACPVPAQPQGQHCVLLADVTLTDTMLITSGTDLNCKGHRMTPAIAGVLDDPRTPLNEFQPSQPDLALFVHRSYGVTIQNCVISGFDFGIIVAQSKRDGAPAGGANAIVGNEIDVRTNTIDIIKSDDVLISGNRLTYASERGRGVVIDFDSDGNEISRNVITSTDAASTGHVRQLPGGPFVMAMPIMDNEIHTLQSDKPLQNFVVNGLLFQVASGEPLTDLEDSSRSDHNLIEANDIVDLGVGNSCTLDPGTPCRADADCAGKGSCLLKQNSGVGFNIRAADTIVRGNRVSGRMERGISFGGVGTVMPMANWFPGACTLDSARMCSTDADCHIPGYDVASVGTCSGSTGVTFNGNTVRLTAEDNELSGVFDAAALFAANSDAFVFRENRVESGASGIRLQPTAIHGLVERNGVAGAANALYLGFHAPYTNIIRLNDLTNYAVAIRTANDFGTMTNISPDTGNYWGLPCPGFDPSRVLFDNGNVNPFVFDEHPHGKPVARKGRHHWPEACQ